MKVSNIAIAILAITSTGFGIIAFNLFFYKNNQIEKIAKLENKNKYLLDELKNIKDKLSEMREEKSLNTLHLNSAPVKKIPSVESKNSVQLEEVKDRESLSEFANSFNVELENDGAHPVDEKFENEEVDYEWAYKYQSNIQEFIQSDQVHVFIIQGLKCKTTKCELELSADSENSMYSGAMFAEAIGKQEWMDKSMTVNFSPVVVNGTIKIQIFRDLKLL